MPTSKQDGQAHSPDEAAGVDWDDWEERAAIAEFDGHEDREDAERLALLNAGRPADNW